MSSVEFLKSGRRVVDAPMRMFHWLLALCFVGAYLTSESERMLPVHAVLGYTMLALLAFRLAYGFWGPRPVQWRSWGTKLRSGWAWIRSLGGLPSGTADQMRSAENLALVLVAAGLMLLPLPLLLSGHLLYVSTLEWFEEVHESVANAMLMLVLAHLGLLLVVSMRRGVNLALPMWRGRVPGAGPNLVASPRVGLAVVLLLVSVTWGLWAAA